jgi:hypothetical protein
MTWISRRGFFFIVIVISVWAMACAPVKREVPADLADKGIVPVSGSNPYLASNIFLAQEMERSNNLFRFMQTRGGPDAIKISEHTLKNPTVTLYYGTDQEYFVAEPGGSEELREWMVRGPFQIGRGDYRILQHIARQDPGDRVFVVFGTMQKFPRRGEWTENGTGVALQPNRVLAPHHREIARGGTIVPEFAIPPTPTPAPRRKLVKAPVQPKAETVVAVAPNTPPIPQNADQQAIAMSKGYAERLPNGDVVHTVKDADETIEAIASWYTGGKEGAGELSTRNKLDPTQTLKAGDRIVIPMSLVKNFRSMAGNFFVQ